MVIGVIGVHGELARCHVVKVHVSEAGYAIILYHRIMEKHALARVQRQIFVVSRDATKVGFYNDYIIH